MHVSQNPGPELSVTDRQTDGRTDSRRTNRESIGVPTQSALRAIITVMVSSEKSFESVFDDFRSTFFPAEGRLSVSVTAIGISFC